MSADNPLWDESVVKVGSRDGERPGSGESGHQLKFQKSTKSESPLDGSMYDSRPAPGEVKPSFVFGRSEWKEKHPGRVPVNNGG
jgi:hypothetical protein